MVCGHSRSVVCRSLTCFVTVRYHSFGLSSSSIWFGYTLTELLRREVDHLTGFGGWDFGGILQNITPCRASCFTYMLYELGFTDSLPAFLVCERSRLSKNYHWTFSDLFKPFTGDGASSRQTISFRLSPSWWVVTSIHITHSEGTSLRYHWDVRCRQLIILWSEFLNFYDTGVPLPILLQKVHLQLTIAIPHNLTHRTSIGTGFSEHFPGIKPHLLTLSSNFRMPLYRDILLSMGICSVSKRSCASILKGGPGQAITIVVGGAAEVWCFCCVIPKHAILNLVSHYRAWERDLGPMTWHWSEGGLNFVEALKYVSDCVLDPGLLESPFSMGKLGRREVFLSDTDIPSKSRPGSSTFLWWKWCVLYTYYSVILVLTTISQIYDQMPNEKGTTIYNLQKKFQNIFGFTLPLFHGRGLLNCQ